MDEAAAAAEWDAATVADLTDPHVKAHANKGECTIAARVPFRTSSFPPLRLSSGTVLVRTCSTGENDRAGFLSDFVNFVVK